MLRHTCCLLLLFTAAHCVIAAVWCKALVARGITTSLAPGVASSIGASPELAAIAVLLQAAVTVVLGSALLRLFAGDKDAAAGIAAGCTAGGIGAAAVGAGKPSTLANGVLAYAAVHVLSAAMLGVPAAGEALRSAVAMAAA
jgi:putative effector of murein hydrolase